MVKTFDNLDSFAHFIAKDNNIPNSYNNTPKILPVIEKKNA